MRNMAKKKTPVDPTTPPPAPPLTARYTIDTSWLSPTSGIHQGGLKWSDRGRAQTEHTLANTIDHLLSRVDATADAVVTIRLRRTDIKP